MPVMKRTDNSTGKDLTCTIVVFDNFTVKEFFSLYEMVSHSAFFQTTYAITPLTHFSTSYIIFLPFSRVSLMKYLVAHEKTSHGDSALSLEGEGEGGVRVDTQPRIHPHPHSHTLTLTPTPSPSTRPGRRRERDQHDQPKNTFLDVTNLPYRSAVALVMRVRVS